MSTTIIGDPDRFAIEYQLKSSDPPNGHIRIWVRGLWLGDIRRSMFLYHTALSLQAMVARNESTNTCIYPSETTLPNERALLCQPSWSWGDSFDDFHFIIFAVMSTKEIHFFWQLYEPRATDFPTYPLGIHHYTVPFDLFDSVVCAFLNELDLQDVGKY